MLVCIGGFIGNGRSVLAKHLAFRGDFHEFDLDDVKFTSGGYSRDGTAKFEKIEPRTDEERTKLYARAARDFPMLAKMYKHVVIHDAFHRRGPREFLINEAKNSFDTVAFIWVDAPEASVEDRLIYMKQKKIISSVFQAMRRRERQLREFEKFEVEPLVFRLARSSAEALRRFDVFLQENLGIGPFTR